MKQTLIDNLRTAAQQHTPSLLSVYASGWKLFSERRRAYRQPNKVRVLIGPTWQPTRLSNPKFYFLDSLLSVERQLGTRGWNIDPIVDHLNRHSKEFACDTFMSESELLSRPVDIVLICKTFDDISLKTIKLLKEKNIKLVYSIVDNSSFDGKCYLDHPEYLELFDHIMLASPIQEQDIAQLKKPFSYSPTPVINTKHKTDYTYHDRLRLYWNGFKQNLGPMRALFPVVKEVSLETGIPMEIILNTNLPESRQDGVHTVPWCIETWEDVMVSSDIGVVIKPPDNFWQRRKPPTKVITYMGAGLPTICTPTAADEGIICHGETAYAAYSETDWRHYLTQLATTSERRRQLGEAGRASVTSQFSIAHIAHKHEIIFRDILRE